MYRKRILSSRSYTPQWDGFICGFVVNFLKQNYWRVDSHMEYEDCMQEARLLFLKVKQHYGNLDSPQHFMALYKIAMTNKFNDLATKVSKHRAELCDDSRVRYYENASNAADKDFNSCCLSFETDILNISDFDNDGLLAIMIEQAPSEIKLVLSLFMTAPVEVLDMFADNWKQRGKNSEFGNNHLCEILGLPEKTDIVGRVMQYFTGTAV